MNPFIPTFLIALTLLSFQQASAGNGYQDGLNTCLQEFHQQVNKTSPPQTDKEVPFTVPTVYRPVHNCAEGLRASANMVKSHIEKVIASYQQEIETADIKNYTCKERQAFQARIAKALLNSQARELGVIRASTASDSNRTDAATLIRAYKDEVSHSTLGVLKSNPSLIMPTSSTEKENVAQVRNSYQRCLEIEVNVQRTPTTRPLYQRIVNLQSIYDAGNAQQKTTGFERCVRKKVLLPMKQETDRLQEIFNGIAKNDGGVDCH